MASFFLAPDPVQSTFLIPGGNTPGTGAQLFIYVAGSVSTPTTVYKDNAGNTAWSNPIVLDSGGNLPNGGVVWIPSGVSIKAVWAPSNDTSPPTSPYRTIDNISGINDTTGSQTEWVSGPTPTFVSGTQFTLVGDQTPIFTKGRRLKFTVTAGTVYGNISSVSFAAVTTANVAFDSGALDAGLSAVSYSVISPANSSISADYANKSVTSVASAGNGTTDIWGIAGSSLHITGTNDIFSFSTAPFAGNKRTVIFDGALTLRHNISSFALPGLANISTTAGDRAEVLASTTANSIITSYTPGGFSPIGTPTVSSFNVSAGTFVYNKPNAIKWAEVWVKAGGGSGGGSASTGAAQISVGAGGAAGGLAIKIFPASSLNATTAVVIGAGGTGVNGAIGNAGSTSSFGAVSATGGSSGGTVAAASAGGQTGSIGGIGSGGDINVQGVPGGSASGSNAGGNTFNFGGQGASSEFGGGPVAVVQGTSAGTNATSTSFGSGGGGAINAPSQPAQTGGNGTFGCVIVRQYF